MRIQDYNNYYRDVEIMGENFALINGEEEASIVTGGIEINMKQNSKLDNVKDEEEYVSKSNSTEQDPDDDNLITSIMHPNENTGSQVVVKLIP